MEWRAVAGRWKIAVEQKNSSNLASCIARRRFHRKGPIVQKPPARKVQCCRNISHATGCIKSLDLVKLLPLGPM